MRGEIVHRFEHPFTGTTIEPVTNAECWRCGRPNPDLAHAVFEYVVSLLAERISKAYNDHQDSCDHCQAEDDYWASTDPGRRWPGECPERVKLWDLLPPAYQPVVIG